MQTVAQGSSETEGREPYSEPFSMRITVTEKAALNFVADLRDVDPPAQLLRSMDWSEVVDEYRRLKEKLRAGEPIYAAEG